MAHGRTPADAVGVVLCGGASRRMGRDKATLDLDGAPMVRRPVAALRAFGAGAVLTVGGDGDALSGTADRHVVDLHPGEGPLGGVATAAAECPGADLVVVACDLPDLDPWVLEQLWAARHSAGDQSVVVPVAGTQVQWAVAVVPGPAAAVAAELFAGGARSLRAGYGAAHLVDVGGLVALEDLDTPDDLRRWRSRSGARG